jgi:hypothetical protein
MPEKGAPLPGIRHVGRWRTATCRIFHDFPSAFTGPRKRWWIAGYAMVPEWLMAWFDAA